MVIFLICNDVDLVENDVDILHEERIYLVGFSFIKIYIVAYFIKLIFLKKVKLKGTYTFDIFTSYVWQHCLIYPFGHIDF